MPPFNETNEIPSAACESSNRRHETLEISSKAVEPPGDKHAEQSAPCVGQQPVERGDSRAGDAPVRRGRGDGGAMASTEAAKSLR